MADVAELTAAVNKLKDRPLFIDDTPALSPTEVRARCKRIQREHGEIGMVMVDYLQLMQIPGRGDNRVAEISEIVKGSKSLFLVDVHKSLWHVRLKRCKGIEHFGLGHGGLDKFHRILLQITRRISSTVLDHNAIPCSITQSGYRRRSE